MWHVEGIYQVLRRVGMKVVASFASLGFLVACGSGGAPQADPAQPLSAAYTGILADATAADASQEQLDEIATYIDGRPVPFSVIRDALERTYACLDKSGYAYEEHIQEGYPGFYSYDYIVSPISGAAETSSPDAGDRCQEMEIEFIGMLYDNQPGIIAARDEAFQRRKPELLQCLRDHGVEVDDDADYDEIDALAVKLYRDSQFTVPDCMPPA